MGDELIEKAQELKTMIQNSAEYQKYDSCRHILKEDEELYRKVNEFRKKNFEFQTEGSAENGQADRLQKHSRRAGAESSDGIHECRTDSLPEIARNLRIACWRFGI